MEKSATSKGHRAIRFIRPSYDTENICIVTDNGVVPSSIHEFKQKNTYNVPNCLQN